jgi:hypothetical protein
MSSSAVPGLRRSIRIEVEFKSGSYLNPGLKDILVEWWTILEWSDDRERRKLNWEFPDSFNFDVHMNGP